MRDADKSQEQKSFIDRETALSAGMPPQEKNQPDPMLQLTAGRLGAVGTALAAVAAAVILSLVLYGLNTGANFVQTAAAPPAAAPNARPQTDGKGGPPAPTGPRANESGVKG